MWQPLIYAIPHTTVESVSGFPHSTKARGVLESVRIVELGCGALRADREIEVLEAVAEVVSIVRVHEKEVVAGTNDPAEPGEQTYQLTSIIVLNVPGECSPGAELPAAR